MVMGAETAVDEDVTTGEPVAESTEPQAEVEAKEAEPTLEELKAALATEKARGDQAEQRLKSTQGQLRGKLDTEAELKAIRREQASTKAYLQALAKGQISGDIAATQKELAEAQATGQRQEFQEIFKVEAEEVMAQIREDMEDAGLEATAPELVEANDVWNEWIRTQDLRQLRKAARLTREVRRNVQVAAWEKEQAEARKKNGSLNTPNIRAAGNRNNAAADAQLEKDVATGRIAMTPEIQKRLDKYWNT